MEKASSTVLALGWTGALGLIGAPGIGMEKVRRNGDEAMWRGGGGVLEIQKVESLIASSNYCFFSFFSFFV